MEESVYNALLKYAIDKEYQEGLTENEKRKIRRQAKQFVAKDNLLYFTNSDGETRRVVRETEKHRILRACHSDSTAGELKFPQIFRHFFYYSHITLNILNK
jgi:hypothetical protein